MEADFWVDCVFILMGDGGPFVFHVGISITNRTRLVCFSLSVGSFSNLNSNLKREKIDHFFIENGKLKHQLTPLEKRWTH